MTESTANETEPKSIRARVICRGEKALTPSDDWTPHRPHTLFVWVKDVTHDKVQYLAGPGEDDDTLLMGNRATEDSIWFGSSTRGPERWPSDSERKMLRHNIVRKCRLCGDKIEMRNERAQALGRLLFLKEKFEITPAECRLLLPNV